MWPRARARSSSASGRSSARVRSVRAVRSSTGALALPGRPLAAYSTTASRSSPRRWTRVRVCCVCSARVTSRCESSSSLVAETTAGVPAARTVSPATATPTTSLLRTRTRRPALAGPSALAVPFFRDRFFCTGARNPVRGVVLVYSCGRGNGRSTSKRPLPPRTASDLRSVLGGEPHIAHPATRRSEHHGGVADQLGHGVPGAVHGRAVERSRRALAICPPTFTGSTPSGIGTYLTGHPGFRWAECPYAHRPRFGPRQC